MTAELLELSLGWVALSALVSVALWRIWRGPTLFDRVLGFDTAMVAFIGFIVVYSISTATTHFLEMILVLTALGFFTTVVFYYYVTRSEKNDGKGPE